MQFIIGLLSGVAFLCWSAGCVYAGHRLGSRHRPQPKIDDEQRMKTERLKKHFSDLFSYDINKALERKKVT